MTVKFKDDDFVLLVEIIRAYNIASVHTALVLLSKKLGFEYSDADLKELNNSWIMNASDILNALRTS
jgi:hypothetical protein